MADRPTIFSGPMVRRLLTGDKTQTRRLASSPLIRCEVGDRLWVREAWAIASIFSDVAEVRYRASERAGHTEFVEQVPVERIGKVGATWPKYRPSIHMPRWASRLTLTVDAVRVERLRAISEADAEAEGVAWDSADGFDVFYVPGANLPHTATAAECFKGLWTSLHDKTGERWEDNPLVVALTFGVVRANVDQVPA